jgi:hypothetical protein
MTDFTNTEFRRELRESDAMNNDAMGPWRKALHSAFGRNRNEISTDEKALLLGVPGPGRRQFLKIGGATVAGAVLLAACSSDDESATTTTAAGGSTTTAASADNDLDLVLLRTATSVELLAVDTYAAAIASGIVTTAAVGEAATLFKAHHEQHAEALQAATEAAGGEVYMMANEYVKTHVVDPALAAAKTEADVLALALTLEVAAVQTYAYAVLDLSTPELRQALMSIGGVENRHATLLRIVSAKAPVVESAFIPAVNEVGDEGLISAR